MLLVRLVSGGRERERGGGGGRKGADVYECRILPYDLQLLVTVFFQLNLKIAKRKWSVKLLTLNKESTLSL